MTRWALAGLVCAALVGAGCGSESASPGATGTGGGSERTTPQALAWLAAEHTGAPSSAQGADDLEELGKGSVGAELRYGSDGEYDGDLLAVAVTDHLPAALLACDRGEHAPDGCERTADGLLSWEREEPEEDPGNVVLVVEKGDAHVLVLYAGPAITGDPRELELPISVDELSALAADPRVDLTTSSEAAEAGESLPYWRD